MSRTSHADRELDSLVAAITIDCYDEDEAQQAFENAFDEDADFPLEGTVVGEDVEVLSVGQSHGRPRADRHLHTRRPPLRHRPSRHHHPRRDPTASRLLAAYRRWLGP